jgi:putative oxidoreductase
LSTQTPEESTEVAERRTITAVDLGLLILRLFLGVIFVAHGAQKVLGLFGGYGLAATVKFMTNSGIPAPLAYLACFTEFLGGLAVLGGLLSRLASAGLSVVMLVAILHVHLADGFFAPKGFEFPFALLGMALVLIVTGPGRIAIADIEGRLLSRKHAG